MISVQTYPAVTWRGVVVVKYGSNELNSNVNVTFR